MLGCQSPGQRYFFGKFSQECIRRKSLSLTNLAELKINSNKPMRSRKVIAFHESKLVLLSDFARRLRKINVSVFKQDTFFQQRRERNRKAQPSPYRDPEFPFPQSIPNGQGLTQCWARSPNPTTVASQSDSTLPHI